MGESFSDKCANHGAEIYRKVADAISSHNGISDEGIANYTGIPSIDLVRMILRDLIWSEIIRVNLEFDDSRNFYIKRYYANKSYQFII